MFFLKMGFMFLIIKIFITNNKKEVFLEQEPSCEPRKVAQWLTLAPNVTGSHSGYQRLFFPRTYYSVFLSIPVKSYSKM